MSRRLPLAALLAPLLTVGLVLLFDRVWLGAGGPWERIRARLERLPVNETRLETGIATDHLELARLARATPEERRVIVMGNSRARVGLRFDRLGEAALGDLVVARCTHAPIAPWVMHSAVERFLALEPDLVVLLLSELDTHRAVNTVPAATFGDPRTALTLAEARRREGLGSLFAERAELQRLTLASLLRAYRYRPVLGHAFLDPLRRFPTRSQDFEPDAPERFPSARAPYDEPSDELPDVPNLDAIRAELERAVGRVRPHTLRLVSRIRPGEHVALQAALVASTVRRLRAAGAQVLLVEGPLNPASHPLYDRASTRADFLALARSLVDDYGAHLLPLEETGPFPPEAFSDVLHLKDPAAMRLTQRTLARMRAILDGAAVGGERE